MRARLTILSAALSAAFTLLCGSAAAAQKPSVHGFDFEGGRLQLGAVFSFSKTMLSGGSLPIIIGLAVVAVILLAAVVIRVKKRK